MAARAIFFQSMGLSPLRRRAIHPVPALERADERFAAVHESGVDAVDGSSTGTQVPKMWVLFEAPTIRRS